MPLGLPSTRHTGITWRTTTPGSTGRFSGRSSWSRSSASPVCCSQRVLPRPSPASPPAGTSPCCSTPTDRPWIASWPRVHRAGCTTRRPQRPADPCSGITPEIQYLADRTFSGMQGVSPAPSWSPSTLRAQLRMPVLIGHAKNDTVVFPSQTRTLCTSAFPNCRAVYLAAGTSGVADFTHADVDDRALTRFRNTEQSFVCSVVSSWSGPCP